MGNTCAWRQGKNQMEENSEGAQESSLLQFQLKKTSANPNPNLRIETANLNEGANEDLGSTDDLKNKNIVETVLLEKEADDDSKDSKTTSENNMTSKDPERKRSNDESSYANETECNSELDKNEQEQKEQELLTIPAPKEKRLSVSAEAYGEWNKKKENFEPACHPKGEEEKAKIRQAINESFIFSRLNEKEIEVIIDAFDVMQVAQGTNIINEGDDGDMLYVINEGEVEIYKTRRRPKREFPDPPGEESAVDQADTPAEAETEATEEKEILTKLKSKDVFGELALLYNAPRAATANALTNCNLWTLDRETFTYIVKGSVERTRQMHEQILEQIPILRDMDPYERCKVADCLKSKSMKSGDVIIQEGEEGDTFYMVIEGSAIAVKDDRVIKTYSKGDYFGELALLKNQPRAATVKTEDACELVYIDRNSFKRLLGPVENILLRNVDHYKQVLNELGIDASCIEAN